MGQIKKPESKAQQQARARLMWENDKLTQIEIAKKVGVHERTIANWAERGLPNPLKGPWVKGSFTEKVQERVENSILATAERLGMSNHFFLTKVKTLCDSKKPSDIDVGLTHAERIIPGLKDPGGRQAFDIRGVDLLQRAVTPGELCAAIMRPVIARRRGILCQRRGNRKQDQGETHGDYHNEISRACNRC